MESIIPAILIISLILLASLAIVDTSLSTQDDVMVLWQEVEERAGERARTELTPIAAGTKTAGTIIEVTLRNDGSTRLADFEQWDVVLQYYSALVVYQIGWYPYGETLVNDGWTVGGIYQDAASLTPEAFEPGIFNPGEEMVLQIKVLPPVGPGTSNMVSVNTEHGIRATTMFENE